MQKMAQVRTAAVYHVTLFAVVDAISSGRRPNTHTASDAKSSGIVLGRAALLTLTGTQFYTTVRSDRGTKHHLKRM